MHFTCTHHQCDPAATSRSRGYEVNRPTYAEPHYEEYICMTWVGQPRLIINITTINYTQVNSTTARRTSTRGSGAPDRVSRAIRDCPRCIRTWYPDTVFAVFRDLVGQDPDTCTLRIAIQNLVTNIAKCQYDTILLMD